MSSADWMMLVLAIYFHDLGMLVTKDKYSSRNSSDFPQFRDERLFTDDPDGRDYRAKVARLSSIEDQERFLYQEFVRANHAKRVRHWIEGKKPPN